MAASAWQRERDADRGADTWRLSVPCAVCLCLCAVCVGRQSLVRQSRGPCVLIATTHSEGGKERSGMEPAMAEVAEAVRNQPDP